MPLARLATLLIAPLVVVLSGCQVATRGGPSTVASLDLDRYMGRWYVIRNTPYFLERGKVASFDTYARLPDGTLSNNFTFRPGSFGEPERTWHGTAKITDSQTNATWSVSFLWPMSVTYKVFAVDPGYKWSVVGTGDAGLLWVLSRERSLSPASYDEALAALKSKGIATDKLTPVPQPPE